MAKDRNDRYASANDDARAISTRCSTIRRTRPSARRSPARAGCMPTAPKIPKHRVGDRRRRASLVAAVTITVVDADGRHARRSSEVARRGRRRRSPMRASRRRRAADRRARRRPSVETIKLDDRHRSAGRDDLSRSPSAIGTAPQRCVDAREERTKTSRSARAAPAATTDDVTINPVERNRRRHEVDDQAQEAEGPADGPARRPAARARGAGSAGAAHDPDRRRARQQSVRG